MRPASFKNKIDELCLAGNRVKAADGQALVVILFAWQMEKRKRNIPLESKIEEFLTNKITA